MGHDGPAGSPTGWSSRWDRGGADVLGFVILTPVLVAIAVAIVGVGRHVETEAQVRSAAAAAAQAAAREATADQAIDSARSAALLVLETAPHCHGATVDVDIGEFAPGGRVGVEVRCSIEQPVGASPTIGSSTLIASAVAGIDQGQRDPDHVPGDDR